jgi:glycosyltransferase involved in cell wall biosynthesis
VKDECFEMILCLFSVQEIERNRENILWSDDNMTRDTILLMGPRASKNPPYLTGGVIVLFEQFVADIKKMGVPAKVIDINKLNYRNAFVGAVSILKYTFKYLKEVSHISIHGTISAYVYLAPVILLIALISKKKVSLRKFAGSLSDIYEKSNFIKKAIIEFVIKKADFTFYETKYLVEYFKKFNKNSFWFPNVRSRPDSVNIPRDYKKKFVFISHVKREKGIDLILKASTHFGKDFVFDIYGPIINSEYTPEELNSYNTFYKMPIEHSNVINTLNQYDVLMLPTHYSEEGYPGIIIEAYSLGIPVISSSMTSIKEICENLKEGILVEPGNTNQFIDAIKYFDKSNYKEFSLNAFRKFELFNSESYTREFLNLISTVNEQGDPGSIKGKRRIKEQRRRRKEGKVEGP